MSAASEFQLATHLRKFSPSPGRDPDAGLRALTHYERRLPRWRYKLRNRLIPVVRMETPHLARVQSTCRSHFLDSYFAFTANLGTHTFFMTFLPVCFWCGYPGFGTALVHMLGFGVYLSGVLKDLVCLPRPLSPPLQRITMSGSAALEYGFPSTHTTNAVSVAIFCLYHLQQSRTEWSALSFGLLNTACYCYAISIMLGRMYCGMHGFFDVAVGILLGALITWIRIIVGPQFDLWILSGGWSRPASIVILLALAVRFHPEPADNCPCFDDSVAFLGVIMGVEVGTWHYAQRDEISKAGNTRLSEMYAYTNTDLAKSAGRLVGGIVVVFLWRAVMKPILLRALPPVFRFVDHWGLMISRRYFLQARDYTQVPPLGKDDNVLPSASEIPSMLSLIRHPRRRRVSVGPQSEADAREYIANREQKRAERRSSTSPRRRQRRRSPKDSSKPFAAPQPSPSVQEEPSEGTGMEVEDMSPASLRVLPAENNLLTPPASDAGASSDSGREDENSDRKMFLSVEKPRTHYDVEVITKLVVYAGIAWLAVEGNPLMFEKLGMS